MNAGGSQRDDHVPFRHFRLVQNLLFIHNAHGEARKIVVLRGHQAGVLCGLAADERRAGLDAALRHAAHDLGDFLRHVFAAGDVIQKEQGLCAHADDVVDAHGHGVDADGVVLIHEDGQFDLGAAAVGAGDQHRLLHPGNGQAEAAAEAAHVIQTA